MTTENDRLKEIFSRIKGRYSVPIDEEEKIIADFKQSQAYKLLEEVYKLLYDDMRTDDEAMELIKQRTPLIKEMFKDISYTDLPRFCDVLNSWTLLMSQFMNFDLEICLIFGKRLGNFEKVAKENMYYMERWMHYMRRLEKCFTDGIIPLEDIPNRFIDRCFTDNFNCQHPYRLDVCEMFIRIVPAERFRYMSRHLAYAPGESEWKNLGYMPWNHDRSAKFFKMFRAKGCFYTF